MSRAVREWGSKDSPIPQTDPDDPRLAGAWGKGGASWFGDLAGQRRHDLRAAACQAPDAPWIWRELALLAYLDGQGDESLAALSRAVLLGDTTPQCRRMFGLVHYGRGAFVRAVDSYRAALLLDPGYAEAWRNQGRACFLIGRFEASADSYRRVVALSPGFAEAWRNLGNTLYVDGRLEAAEGAYRRAVEADPADPSNHYNLAFALVDRGRMREAGTAYRRALAIQENPLFLIGLRQTQEALGDGAAEQTHARLVALVTASWRAGADAAARKPAPKLVHLRPLPSDRLLADRGVRIDRRPLPDIAIRRSAGTVHPDARRSVEVDQRWAGRGLSLAGPGEIQVRYNPTWTNSAILTDRHYLRDTYYDIPLGDADSRVFLHPLYKRDVDDLYDWTVDLAPLPEIEIDEPCVYLGGSSNFGHFIGDIVSRLFVLETFGVPADLPVYLYPLKPSFREIVETLFPGRRLVDMGSLAGGKALFRFRRALVPAEPPYALTCPAYRRRICELGLFDPGRSRGDRLFITRRNESSRNRIGNEEELTDRLSREGFTVVCPAELGFRDLIAAYGAARQIVSPQGAQNVNLMFARPDCHFVEILPANQKNYAGALGYASIYVYSVGRYNVLWGDVRSMDLNLENDAQPVFPPDELLRIIGEGGGRRGD
ncbi:tetratricopeptide repeat protein [Azospirillum melinis]